MAIQPINRINFLGKKLVDKRDMNYNILTKYLPLTSVKVAQSRCNTMDYTVHGILQARILVWVAFLFSRASFQPRDQTQVSRIAGGFFISRATRDAHL